MKKIVFTGGGSAGHVVPNIALMEELKNEYDLYYIGTDGIEKRLVSPLGVPFGEIVCPKFVRGISLQNLSIPHRLCAAVRSARQWLEKIRPDLVFSKGGYVALPVVYAAARLHVPALTHESDLSVGLANRLMAGKCKNVLTSFPETAKAFPNGICTGSPMRNSLFGIPKDYARSKYGFAAAKPVLLFLGGGSGSAQINSLLRAELFDLAKKYYILHLCGKGNAVQSRVAGYVQTEYERDMGCAYACADAVVCRAGSNTLFEVLALKKPTLLIPLCNQRSRGDQVRNAEYFERRGLCRIRRDGALLPQIEDLLSDMPLRKNLTACEVASGNANIISVIRKTVEEG